MDDCVLGIRRMKLGTRWCNKRRAMIWSQEWEAEDQKEAKTPEQITMEQFTSMANQVTSYLKFTWDSPEQHEDKRMPVLDTAMWMGMEEREMGVPEEIMGDMDKPFIKGRLSKVILTRFYRKPMARSISMLERSAMPIGTTNATVSAEFLRRFKNTSREMKPEVI